MKRVIITGDDFGLAEPVNDAIVGAHRDGILTSASLMVSAAAAADAVEKARQNPALRVGLHVVLVEGRSVLPPAKIPNVVNSAGEFLDDPARAGFKFAFWPRIRRELAAEIRAQFEAFRKTGLALDHVDVHNHLHLHPRIFNLVLEIGRDFGVRAMRVPDEPPLPGWRTSCGALARRSAAWASLLPLVAYMKWRLRRDGILFNDHLLGIHDSGAMTYERLRGMVEHMPEGITEIHCHPSVRRCPEIDRAMPEYLSEEEYRALINPELRAAFEYAGIRRIAFGDL